MAIRRSLNMAPCGTMFPCPSEGRGCYTSDVVFHLPVTLRLENNLAPLRDGVCRFWQRINLPEDHHAMRTLGFITLLALTGWLIGCGNVGPGSTPPAVHPSPSTAKSTAPQAGEQETASTPTGSLEAAADDESGTEITLTTVDYDGVIAAVEKHKGKVVVMDAWATWCGPCVKEFPNLVKLHHKYDPEKVACISLSFNDGAVTDDPEDGAQAATKFLKEQKATFDNLLTANQDVWDQVYRKFEFGSIPAVFVYDQEGNLAKLFRDGGKDAPPIYEQVEELVKELLGKEEG